MGFVLKMTALNMPAVLLSFQCQDFPDPGNKFLYFATAVQRAVKVLLNVHVRFSYVFKV